MQALERQQHVSDALQEPAYFQPQTPAVKGSQLSANPAAIVESSETSAPKVHKQSKSDQPTIKYSRKAIPSTKQ